MSILYCTTNFLYEAGKIITCLILIHIYETRGMSEIMNVNISVSIYTFVPISKDAYILIL